MRACAPPNCRRPPIRTIEPLIVSATPQVAFEAAHAGHHQAQVAHRRCARAAAPGAATAASRRWRARRSSAFATTWWCASAPIRDGARVDIRSTSRYGRHDFGTNAARVRRAVRSRSTMRSATSTPEKPRRADQEGARRPIRRRSRPSQPINAADRRAGRRSRPRRAPTRSSMCASTEKPAAPIEPRIEPDIDRAHDGRDVGRALGEPVQDRGFARLAVPDVGRRRNAARRGPRRRGRANRSARSRRASLCERAHVVAHRAVRRRHDRGRPPHHVIAGEHQVRFLQRERHVVRGMAGRRRRASSAQPSPLTTSPSASAWSGRKSMSLLASMRGASPALSGREARCGPSA